MNTIKAERSSIRLNGPVWKLFQSKRQLSTGLIAWGYAAVFVLLMHILYWHERVHIIEVVCFFIGGSYPLFVVLPATWTIPLKIATNDYMAKVREWLFCRRYIVDHYGRNGEEYYQFDVPRWMRWDESNIEIRFEPDRVLVKGPVVFLRRVRRKLKEDEKRLAAS